MNLEAQRQLYALAQREAQAAACYRSCVSPLTTSSFTLDLYVLACQIRGVDTMRDSEILTTFFTPEAVALLMPLPNLYWFWHMVRRALTHYEHLHGTLISAEAVHSAIRVERIALWRIFDLCKDIETLPRPEFAAWVAAGVIVVAVDNTNNSYQLVRNPIFAPPVR